MTALSKSRRIRLPAPLLAVLTVAGVGCDVIPASQLHEALHVEVFDRQLQDQPTKIDFLWVIDDSSSMCEEQASLVRQFRRFVDTLRASISLDARMAVVTTSVLNNRATFQHTPAHAFPPTCRREVVKACRTDGDCLLPGATTPALPAPPGGSLWRCDGASGFTSGSQAIHSRCRLACDGDAACAATFGSDFRCEAFAGNVAEPGCMIPPPTESCPPAESLPPVLTFSPDGQNADLFRCIATVGADPSFNANLEQGLNAARFALDPRGPNADQAAQLLRDDAWLVLVFLSDEDDCSLSPQCLLDEEDNWRPASDTRRCIAREDYNSCDILGDADSGGPLEPVGRFVNFFKSLKADPSRVLVASIVGDSQRPTAAGRAAHRASHLNQRRSLVPGVVRAPICASDAGVANLGHRYHQLAEAFGSNGISANICGPPACTLRDGSSGYVDATDACRAYEADEEPGTIALQQALDRVGETVIRRTAHLCLPLPARACSAPPDDPTSCAPSQAFRVSRVAPTGAGVDLARAPAGEPPGPGQFQVEPNRACPGPGLAVIFGDSLTLQEQIELRYAAETGLLPE